MRKLPVIRSVSEVFSGVTRHYFQLVGAAWPALVFVAVGLGLYGWAYYESGAFEVFAMIQQGQSMDEIAAAIEAADRGAIGPAYFAGFLIMFLASAVAAVRWHRFVLMGEGNGVLVRAEDGRYIWTFIKVMLLYFVAIVALALVFVGIAGIAGASSDAGNSGLTSILMLIFGIGIVAAYLLVLGILLRLMLALPDAAIGQPGKVIGVFSASQGNTWRMVGYGLLIGLIYTVILFGLVLIMGLLGAVLGGGAIAVLLLGAVGLAAYFYFLMLQITMLSVAYREIVGLPGGHEGEATVAEPTPGL